jgi:hypothetical protein
MAWRQISAAGALLTALWANASGCGSGCVGYGWREAVEDVAGAGLVIALFPLLLARRWPGSSSRPALRRGTAANPRQESVAPDAKLS